MLMTKNLRTLTSKFPAFGVLFETISAARTDLVCFTVIFGAMAAAATTMCYCLFGPNDVLFSSMAGAGVSVLQMLFGRDLFDNLYRSNSDAAVYFLIFYSVVFYFVILNVYAAIVKSTYANLRQKKQLTTEAMADIFAEEAEEQSNKVRNIICCTMDRV
jgi:hypothetical protein